MEEILIRSFLLIEEILIRSLLFIEDIIMRSILFIEREEGGGRRREGRALERVYGEEEGGRMESQIPGEGVWGASGRGDSIPAGSKRDGRGTDHQPGARGREAGGGAASPPRGRPGCATFFYKQGKLKLLAIALKVTATHHSLKILLFYIFYFFSMFFTLACFLLLFLQTKKTKNTRDNQK